MCVDYENHYYCLYCDLIILIYYLCFCGQRPVFIIIILYFYIVLSFSRGLSTLRDGIGSTHFSLLCIIFFFRYCRFVFYFSHCVTLTFIVFIICHVVSIKPFWILQIRRVQFIPETTNNWCSAVVTHFLEVTTNHRRSTSSGCPFIERAQGKRVCPPANRLELCERPPRSSSSHRSTHHRLNLN